MVIILPVRMNTINERRESTIQAQDALSICKWFIYRRVSDHSLRLLHHSMSYSTDTK